MRETGAACLKAGRPFPVSYGPWAWRPEEEETESHGQLSICFGGVFLEANRVVGKWTNTEKESACVQPTVKLGQPLAWLLLTVCSQRWSEGADSFPHQSAICGLRLTGLGDTWDVMSSVPPSSTWIYLHPNPDEWKSLEFYQGYPHCFALSAIPGDIGFPVANVWVQRSEQPPWSQADIISMPSSSAAPGNNWNSASSWLTHPKDLMIPFPSIQEVLQQGDFPFLSFFSSLDSELLKCGEGKGACPIYLFPPPPHKQVPASSKCSINVC